MINVLHFFGVKLSLKKKSPVSEMIIILCHLLTIVYQLPYRLDWIILNLEKYLQGDINIGLITTSSTINEPKIISGIGTPKCILSKYIYYYIIYTSYAILIINIYCLLILLHLFNLFLKCTLAVL